MVLCSARFIKTAVQVMPWPITFRLMSDFDMRYNEACCVHEGVDPFEVWRGEVKDSRYEPWSFAKLRSKDVDFSRFIHAYPPWEYTCMLPFVGLERRSAETVFMVMMFSGLLALSCGWFCVGYRKFGRLCWGLLLLAFCWGQASPVTACLVYGNFGIWIAVAVAVALYCHVRKWDGWAGVFWALAMVKPQVATIFLVPLLLLRKWRTLAVWGSLLLGMTLIPSLLCRTSPVDLVLCIRQYSAEQFSRTGFIGKPIFVSLVQDGGISPSLLSGASALAGGVICVVCTALVLKRRSKDDGLEKLSAFVPALVLSTIWTASRIHDFCIQSVTAPLLMLFAIQTRDRWSRFFAVLLSVGVSMMFWDQYQSGLVNVCSMLCVVLLVVYCYRISVGGDRAAERESPNV